jgi:hypothetical protein
VLRPILAGLYYPHSPYEFSVLPADILGQVYEQFLGKVIRLTPGHRAIVEEKPEVKKAGGVYYTPTYIVEYIVARTVGRLVEGKSPKQISELRILVPPVAPALSCSAPTATCSTITNAGTPPTTPKNTPAAANRPFIRQ